MIATAEMTRSYWTSIEPPTFPPLSQNQTVDVCVVGGGVAGLTTAYLLARSGKRVIVLEDGEIGSGESGRTTAHLTNALDDRYFELASMHHASGARLAAESHTAAIDKIEMLVRELEIDCDFTRLDGYLFVSPTETDEILQKELTAAEQAGLKVEWANRAPIDFNTGPCLRFPKQAQFHPLKYLSALATAIVSKGGMVFTHSHASEIKGGDKAMVKTAAGATVHATAIVIATNTPINDRMIMHTKQAPYRSYVVGMEVPTGQITPALYWDTADPYHYARIAGEVRPGFELLIVGGEDHKTGQSNDGDLRFQQLENWTRTHFAQVGETVFRWSGQVLEPIDGLAYIGRNPMDSSNVYIATGDSGNGMTHGTIAGMVLHDLIIGVPNPWTQLYAPDRKPISALREFVHENSNVAEQYLDWITPGECQHADQIPHGSGRILRQGLQKFAVYRDTMGVVHTCKATCPHLGCLVSWNDTENTWDCPCHGSRFTGKGEVVCGPSKVALEKIPTPSDRD